MPLIESNKSQFMVGALKPKATFFNSLTSIITFARAASLILDEKTQGLPEHGYRRNLIKPEKNLQ